MGPLEGELAVWKAGLDRPYSILLWNTREESKKRAAGVLSGGNVPMIMGSLIGHLMYDGIVGAVYGAARPVPVPA